MRREDLIIGILVGGLVGGLAGFAIHYFLAKRELTVAILLALTAAIGFILGGLITANFLVAR